MAIDTDYQKIIDKLIQSNLDISNHVRNNLIIGSKLNNEFKKELLKSLTEENDNIENVLVSLSDTIKNDLTKNLYEFQRQNKNVDLMVELQKGVNTDIIDQLTAFVQKQNIASELKNIFKETLQENSGNVDKAIKEILFQIQENPTEYEQILELHNNNILEIEKVLKNSYKEMKKERLEDKRFPNLVRMVEFTNKKVQDGIDYFLNTTIGEFMTTSLKPIVEWSKSLVNNMLPGEINEIVTMFGGFFTATRNFLMGDKKQDRITEDILSVVQNIKESFRDLMEKNEAFDAMIDLADAGTSPGSIYTHDINAEDMLRSLLDIEEERERRHRREVKYGGPIGLLRRILGLLLGPTGWLIGLVGGLVVGVTDVLSKGRFFQHIIPSITNFVRQIGNAFVMAFRNTSIINTLNASLIQPFRTLITNLRQIGGMTSIINRMAGGFRYFFITPVVKFFTWGRAIGQFITRFLRPLYAAVLFFKAMLFEEGDIFDKLSAGITGIVDAFLLFPFRIAAWITEKLLGLMGIELNNFANNTVGLVRVLTDWVFNTIRSYFQFFTGQITLAELHKQVWGYVKTLFIDLAKYGQYMIDWIRDQGMLFLGKIMSTFLSFLGINIESEKIADLFRMFYDDILDGLGNIIYSIIEFFGDFWGNLKRAVGEAILRLIPNLPGTGRLKSKIIDWFDLKSEAEKDMEYLTDLQANLQKGRERVEREKADKAMLELAEAGTEPGSIYTHDMHLEKIFKDMFDISTKLEKGGHYVHDFMANTFLFDIRSLIEELLHYSKLSFLFITGKLSRQALNFYTSAASDAVENFAKTQTPTDSIDLSSGGRILTTRDNLGDIAAHFESASSSSAIGYDSAGGTSYGRYQIAAKTGTMQKFLEHLKRTDPEAAAELLAAGPLDTGGKVGAAVNVWKRLAKEGRIQQAEHDFIKETHFNPAAKYAESLGYDLNDPRIQEMIWSGAVQHGGINKILATTAGNIDLSSASTDDILSQFYKDRTKYALHYAPSDTHKGILRRYGLEEQMIAGMDIGAMEQSIYDTENNLEDMRSAELNDNLQKLGLDMGKTTKDVIEKQAEQMQSFQVASTQQTQQAEDIPIDIENIGLLFYNKTWGLS